MTIVQVQATGCADSWLSRELITTIQQQIKQGTRPPTAGSENTAVIQQLVGELDILKSVCDGPSFQKLASDTTATRDMVTELVSGTTATGELLKELVSGTTAIRELLTELVSGTTATRELLTELVSGTTATRELLTELVSGTTATRDILKETGRDNMEMLNTTVTVLCKQVQDSMTANLGMLKEELQQEATAGMNSTVQPRSTSLPLSAQRLPLSAQRLPLSAQVNKRPRLG